MTRYSLSIPEYKSDDEPKENLSHLEIQKLTEVDVEVNAEIMRRLLVFLGMQDLDAKKTVEKPQVIAKAEMVNDDDGSSIKLIGTF